MGTRGLTQVIDKAGKTKVAQYGQWDHYPSGQGLTALKFLRKKGNIEKLKQALKKTRFATDADRKERDAFLKSIGSDNGFVNMDQSKKYDEKFPFDTRDHGAKILELVCESPEKEIVLIDQSEFAKDGLFCEGVFTINLKKNTFEIDCGRNRSKTYSLDKLPTPKKFLADFKGE